MSPDRDARDLHAGARVAARDADQGQVGRPSPDVTDQDQRLPLRSFDERGHPRFAGAVHPVVERGGRLFEQARREPDRVGGLEGELARGLVERRGDGEHHLLLGERRLWMGGVPRAAHVLEVAGARIDRRDPRRFGFRIDGPGAPRQDRRAAIDRAVSEPTLRRRDLAAGDLGAAPLRVLAADPGSVAARIGQAFRVDRGVERRGEHRARGDLGRGDELGNREDLGLEVAPRGCEGDDGVRRAEIDSDEEGSHHARVLSALPVARAHVELDLPALVRRERSDRDRLEEERAHLGDRSTQAHGDDVPLGAPLRGEA